MNKELIELQQGVNSTCVIILDEFYRDLGQTVFMDAKIKDPYLIGTPFGEPLFQKQLDRVSSNGSITYFVIRLIDQIKKEEQNRFINLIKNREFHGYTLPENVIVVFTIQSRENIKNISEDLYHFSVAAF